MKFYLLLFTCCMITCESFGQDSLKLDSELNFELKGQHVLSAIANNPIACISCPSGFVTDNPFHHFAIYTGINYKGTLAEKYTFETGLYLEERSFSHGNNTIENLVLFPRIKISAIDSFKMNEHQLSYNLSAGDYWAADFEDVLRIHNIDFQGLKLIFKWNEFSLGFYAIGDLSQNIGLDLHELYKLSLGYENLRFKNIFSLSVNELYAAPFGNHPDSRDFNIANYSKIQFSEQLSGETQLDMRTNTENRVGLAAGIIINYQHEDLRLITGLRYYQAAFNQGYIAFRPRYRIGDKYIGPQLYPLKNYYRPLNQWALFTNYIGRDLLNWEFGLNWNEKIYRKLSFIAEIDCNLIYDLSLQEVDFYPLYNIGISMNFLQNFVLSITGTNKHMNLDTYYQTAYASKLPLLSYNFKMNIEDIQLKPKYLKY